MSHTNACILDAHGKKVRMLCEAGWRAIRPSPTARGYFERIERGKQDRGKIAIVATAHYLARVMLAMLRRGEAWRGAFFEPSAALAATKKGSLASSK